MITPETYREAWLQSHRSKPSQEKINPPLAEKMIHALGLVEALAMTKLPFIFKGGTSLILLIDSAGRFSIDIDIITTADRQSIEDTLQSICNEQPFRYFALNEKRSYKPGVPKAHYSLYYTSALTGKEDHILLDILFDKHTYPAVMQLPVKSDWLLTDDQEVLVTVPTIESITGDKLTAFAPTTTGILYSKGKEVEIVKQLHDVGKLYDKVSDLSIVITAFSNTVEKEIQYRGNTCTRDQVLDDIIHTGMMIARREKNTTEPGRSQYAQIKLGLLQFKAYQIASPFRIDEALTASAKAAVLAMCIQKNVTTPLPVYNSNIEKKDFLIENQDYNFLNNLPAEAVFYWSKLVELLN